MLRLVSEDPLLLFFRRRTHLFWLKAAFFASGFTALVFEVLWTRLFTGIAGSTAASMTCVFTVFIVCMALGAFFAARLRTSGRGALVLYGMLEAAVGAWGLLLTMLLLRHELAVASLIGPSGFAARLAAAFLLIGPPTFLMGMSLPVVLNGLKGQALARDEVCAFYGLNTLGGAFGALAAGFFLIWQLGITRTALAALGLNLLVCLTAVAISRRLPAERGERLKASPWRSLPELWENLRSEPLMPVVAFLVGFASLAYELLWGRMAKLFLGNRTLAVAALLFIYLSCLALGSFLADRISLRWALRERVRVLLVCVGAMAAAAVLHLFSVKVIHGMMTGSILPALLAGGGSGLARCMAALLVLLLPVTSLGLVLPLLLRSSEAMDESPSRAAGLLYGANTLGAALGAVMGGYFLPLAVGTLGSFGLLSAALVLSAATAMLLYAPGANRFAYSGLTGLLFVSAWLSTPKDLLLYDRNERLVFSNEDEYGIQLATLDKQGLLTLRNDRVKLIAKLGLFSTRYAQESIAYFSCLLSGRCKDVLNIGTGYGITAGAFSLFDEVESLRTVELLPAVISIQSLFREHNRSYFTDRRVERIQGDGRQLLASEDRTYDVISVNVLDPYLPGSSSLYTVEFWKLAKSRLNPGGVYSHRIGSRDLQLLLRGLKSVFPTVLYFPVYNQEDYNIVAFAQRQPSPELHMGRLTPRALKALKILGGDDPEAFLRIALKNALAFEKHMDVEAGKFPPRPLHSDDRPMLEYQWSHGYRGISSFDSTQTVP